MPTTQHRKSATPADFFSASKRIKAFVSGDDDLLAAGVDVDAIGGGVVVTDGATGGGVVSIECSLSF
jgi:hypothetical protein